MTKIKCTLCGEIIESKYRHDYVECSCKSTFADGGSDYVRTSIYGRVVKYGGVKILSPERSQLISRYRKL